MRKALLACALAVMLLPSAALAEIYEGAVAAGSTIPITAEAGGILEEMNVEAGSIVGEGDVLGSIRTTRVYAAQEGTVARIHAGEGEDAHGAVLELTPVERYRIVCSVSKAYQSADSTLVHAGEQVYIKCTADGSHRGVGLITQIDGSEYSTLAIGGEFYVGETVYLYRDADFSSGQRVGIGTVVGSDTEVYEAEGTIVRMHVAEGEYVERGELLYETADSADVAVTAAMEGIVTGVSGTPGARVESGATLLTVAPVSDLCIEFMTDESAAAQLQPGDAVSIIYTADPEETTAAGTITEISQIADDGKYRVRIAPQRTDGLRLGMTATIITGAE